MACFASDKFLKSPHPSFVHTHALVCRYAGGGPCVISWYEYDKRNDDSRHLLKYETDGADSPTFDRPLQAMER